MQAVETNRRLVKFIVAAVLFFAWVVILGALQANRLVPPGIIVGAHTHAGTMGWISLSLAALIYYLVPSLTNKPIAAPRLIDWIFWIWVIVLVIMLVLMHIVAFAGMIEAIMMIVGMIAIILAIIALIFVVQVLVSIGRKARP